MSTEQESLVKIIIKRTLRVPAPPTEVKRFEASERLSRQLDIALLEAGYKASAELLDKVATLEPVVAKELIREIVESAFELKGGHVKHNAYFKDFPEGVPDTLEFWTSLVQKTFGPFGFLWDGNLLALDGYGEYQHTYEEMVAAHAPFVESGKEKNTVLHLGDSLQDETLKLYTSLAEAKVPANGDDLVLLKRLAEVCLDYPQPDKIPVRENKAVINAVRIEFAMPLLVDTVTDVIRLAAQLSGSDVTLNTKPKFKSFPNRYRIAMLVAFEDIISKNPAKLGDVFKNREVVKRLFVRLNNKQKDSFKNAYRVLHTATQRSNLSFESKLEKAFKTEKIGNVVDVLKNNPGLFVRSLNRVLLQARLVDEKTIVEALRTIVPKVSTPVLISLRQYLFNRHEQKSLRLFINRKGTGKVVKDEQPVLPRGLTTPISDLIDTEIQSRFKAGTYIVDEDILTAAIPLSNKMTGTGFGIVPRGTVEKFEGEVLRFFMYWKQKAMQTDYDLSAILLNKNFVQIGQVSFTNLRASGIKHSGDITSAPKGASEFIDIKLDKLQAEVAYIVPQVNMYGGEQFDQVEESFFGYMVRTEDQMGKPFEIKTVTTKSELRGSNNVAVPLLFARNADGQWYMKQLNMFLKGYGWANSTENNAFSSANIVRGIVETEYLVADYLVKLLQNRDDIVFYYAHQVAKEDLAGRPEDYKDTVPNGFGDEKSVTYISRQTPEGLSRDFKTINLNNLYEIIP